MSTKITYNGKTTELADGYIATLPCKDKKMETDVKIEAPEGGRAEMNIAYGDTAPEDTSKLWVKTTQPSAVKVSSKVEYITGNEGFTKLEAVLPSAVTMASAASVGDNIYIFGGWNGSASLNTMWKFDTITKAVSVLDVTLPVAKHKIGVAVVGTIIYLLGGSMHSSYNSSSPEIYCFDTETETLTTHSTVLYEGSKSNNGISACACGTDIWFYTQNAVNVFNTITGTIDIATGVTLNYGRQSAALQAVNGYVYALGGYQSLGSSSTLTEILKYDATTKKGIKLTATLSRATMYALSMAFDGIIYILGGSTGPRHSEANTTLNVVQCFDTTTEICTTLPITLPSPKRGNHSATTVGSVGYIFGGGYNPEFSTDIIEFVPNIELALTANNVQIIPSLTDNTFNLINTNAAQVEIGVGKVYKGNADGIAEEVEAALHNGTSWVTI